MHRIFLSRTCHSGAEAEKRASQFFVLLLLKVCMTFYNLHLVNDQAEEIRDVLAVDYNLRFRVRV